MLLSRKYFSKAGALFRLALPVMLAQLGYIAVQVADTAMVGSFDGDNPVPLAAVAFGTGISWIFFFLCIGLSIGITPVVGELFVQERKQEMAHYLQTSLVLYPLFGLLCMGLQIASEPLLYHLDQPTDVVEMALPYYRLMAYGLLGIALRKWREEYYLVNAVEKLGRKCSLGSTLILRLNGGR